MWLRVLTGRKVAIYSDGITLLLLLGFLRSKLVLLVLLWLRWNFIGSIGNSLAVWVFHWLLPPR